MGEEKLEEPDFNKLQEIFSERFGKNVSILLRAHRKDKRKWMGIKKTAEIINAGNYPEIMELMLACDVGITDYSSWIFDFLFLGKPGFIYAPDEEMYQKKRGFYYPLEEAPFSVANDMIEMEKNIIEFNEEDYKKKIGVFLDKRGCIEAGAACKSLVEIFRNEMK